MVSPNPVHDDRALLRAWSSGRDEAAFTLFVRRHLGMVQGAALRKTARPELAEEVAQEVFALAARRAASLAEHPSAGAWLHRTTVFVCANVLRRELKHRKTAAAMLIHPDTSPEAGLPETVLPYLDEALNSLPARDRHAVLLRFGERLSYDQMATRLGKSADACQKQTGRALDRLRGLLSRHAALPVTTLAAGLTAALSIPASATAAGKMGAAALAAAPKITLSALLQNILHTMTTGHQIVAAAGVAVLLLSVPLGMQYSEAGTLREKLAALSSRDPLSTMPVQAAPKPPREKPGSRIFPGVSAEEADRTLGALRSLKGRMLTSIQLLEIGEQLMALPLSHLGEAQKVIDEFPGMMPGVPLRLAVFSRWGELDPEAAMAAAGAMPFRDPVSPDMIKFALAVGWMERDPEGLAAWLRDHPTSPLAGPMAGMLGLSITSLDRETVQQLRGVRVDGGFPGQLLLEWESSAEDGDVAAMAESLLEDMPAGYDRESLLEHTARSLAGSGDPRSGLDFVLAHAGPDETKVARALAAAGGAWATEDLAGAAAWAWTQGGKNPEAVQAVWARLGEKKEEEILTFLNTAPDEAGRAAALSQAALHIHEDTEKALRLLAALPEEPRYQAMETYGQRRAESSLMETSEWLLTLPEGPDKDAAVRGFAPVLVKSDAESAMVWAASTAEGAARVDLLRRLGQEWLQKAPEAAQAWMQSSEVLTDADRAAITTKP